MTAAETCRALAILFVTIPSPPEWNCTQIWRVVSENVVGV